MKLIVNIADIKLYYEYKFFLKNGDSIRATVSEIKDNCLLVGDGALFCQSGVVRIEDYEVLFDDILGALDEGNCENYAMKASRSSGT